MVLEVESELEVVGGTDDDVVKMELDAVVVVKVVTMLEVDGVFEVVVITLVVALGVSEAA